MKRMLLLFVSWFILLGFLGIVYPQGTDNANESAYNDGWSTGDNGGTGFGAWTLTGGANAGLFIGSSDNINTNGKSFGLWAKNGATSSAVRDFSSAMAESDRFTIYMENGWIQYGGTVGFGLQNSSGNNIIEVYFVGGGSHYTVNDNSSGPAVTTFEFTGNGLKIEVDLNTSSTYTVKLSPAVGGSVISKDGSFTGIISRLRLFNYNAGDDSNYDLYFNSLSHEIGIVPVELSLFTGMVSNNNVNLTWQTVTEINNYGFEIERSGVNVGQTNSLSTSVSTWEKIGFVAGHGNSNSTKDYTFADNTISSSGKYAYRLKQIDNDGTFKYSPVVETDVTVNLTYALGQNYPNPFNPTTKISYTLPETGLVTLRVYNIIGQTVSMLVNQLQDAGKYEVEFNANGLSNGVYFYELKANGFTSVKKLMLVK